MINRKHIGIENTVGHYDNFEVDEYKDSQEASEPCYSQIRTTLDEHTDPEYTMNPNMSYGLVHLSKLLM